MRNNTFANEDVIGAVEQFGGEVWMLPITDWVIYTSSLENYKEEFPGTIISWDKADTWVTYTWMKHWEKKLMEAASPFLDDRHEPRFQEYLELATPYIPFYLGGEGKLSVGRAIKYAQQGAAMVVNCAPFGCMPETVATAIFGRVSADVDMPIVSLFYDGSGGQNRRLEVFLNNAVRGRRGLAGLTEGAGKLPPGFPSRDQLVPAQNLVAAIGRISPVGTLRAPVRARGQLIATDPRVEILVKPPECIGVVALAPLGIDNPGIVLWKRLGNIVRYADRGHRCTHSTNHA